MYYQDDGYAGSLEMGLCCLSLLLCCITSWPAESLDCITIPFFLALREGMVNVILEVRMIAHSLDEVTLDRVY